MIPYQSASDRFLLTTLLVVAACDGTGPDNGSADTPGAIVDLRDFIDHYSESDLKLHAYDVNQLEAALRPTLLANAADILLTRDTLLNGVVFPPEVVDQVTEFMKALTDPAARDLGRLAPRRVPSGLPLD
jgi:hypothetical protein